MNQRATTALLAAACLLAAQPLFAADGKSLYSEGGFQSLTADHKARKVGDVITVLVYEDSSASSTADTSTGRNADVGVTLQLPLGGHSPYRGTHSAAADTGNTFAGTGQTERAGHVVAQITVPVMAVMDNGDLEIGGTQELEINGERQSIHIEGRVRVADVTEGNTVLSTRIADAHISMAGKGTVDDQQKPGWWQRMLTWFGV